MEGVGQTLARASRRSGARLGACSRERLRRRINERDDSNGVALPVARQAGERVGENPFSPFTYHIHPVEGQWPHVVCGIIDGRHQRPDHIRTIETNGGSEGKNGGGGEALVHVTAQEVEDGPASLFVPRPIRSGPDGVGATREIVAPEGEDLMRWGSGSIDAEPHSEVNRGCVELRTRRRGSTE